jgi:hypothetical protein
MNQYIGDLQQKALLYLQQIQAFFPIRPKDISICEAKNPHDRWLQQPVSSKTLSTCNSASWQNQTLS